MPREIYKTDIEKIMEEGLKKAGIIAVFQYPVRCKYGYILDYAIPESKIDIECDGEAWHKAGNSHDRKRNAYLKSKGWIILRFTGKEIIENIQKCIDKIKTYLI